MEEKRPAKPLNRKAYGHIMHLPGSRMGPGDHRASEYQTKICTTKLRDQHDEVIVQEKVDGSCVAVVKLEGQIIPLMRAGYIATTSPYEQHWLFADWVYTQYNRFVNLLDDGQRVVGEWLALAHSTKYTLKHEPFCPFDIMVEDRRIGFDDFIAKVVPGGFTPPKLLHRGPPISIGDALKLLGPGGHHGALDQAEGMVYRVQRDGGIDFLTKYVRPDKVSGCYLPEITGDKPIWNWRP